ncbi:DUF2235 domain-containing protein [Aquabacterium sp. CECT 9606]|uniref:T6SS phospholipase effector Tle1-like catalytic domain-containing protein n=1 Tax=Aquabacterium sp. CECT 9606 TaxID=2845822 RepID=UPI001E4E1CD2|nr:DUF2235 domain-containing protein [Aquabacterium sp. CECT 9606]CAH0350671.1 hypothetical protein AQB9606_01597 [Aquabacterium sp. CECT 9606]
MSENLQSPPKAAPYYPSAQALKLPANSDARSFLSLAVDDAGKPCSIPVQVGLFFDGTNNNLERDLNGKRIAVPVSTARRKKLEAQANKAEGKFNSSVERSLPKQKSPLPFNEASHSNVARLYQAFPNSKTAAGLHGIYIQGVGTDFPEIGEPTESAEGKAFAKGGQARIIWGLFQVLNAIHMTVFTQEPLYKKAVLGQLAQAYGREIGRVAIAHQRDGKRVTHKDWFAPHIDKLQAALKATPKPAIPSVTVSVFGFSRGGAEAVAFCHLFDKLLEGGCLAGIKAEINFLGVFDVVASVGGSASVAKTLPMPGAIFDGHWSWANYVDKPLPGCVTKGVHLIAAHEMRMNFPVTRQRGGGMQEFLYPGSHSDVGGGYAPNEQGKARGGQGSLLSQIPLAHMYLAARKAGVPLLPFSEMTDRAKVDFEVDANLASAWKAYAQELGDGGGVLKSHMSLFYRWKAMRLTSLESTASFQASSEQDKEDLSSANRLLAGDLELLHHRKSTHAQHHDRGHSNQPEFGSEYRYKANQWQVIRANSHTALDEWETFAVGHFENPEPLPDDVARFFDDHVHDSFATFYMAGEVTEFDKRSRVERVMDQDPSELKGFDKKIHQKTTQVHEAQAKQARGEELTAEDAALVKEAEYGTPYPVMKDEDASDLLSWGEEMAVRTQSGTRREGGGYFVRRGYYPHSGFFIRRSEHEDELRQAPPKRVRKGEDEDNASAVYEWSNNLIKDIAQARKEQEELVQMA